MRKERPEVPAPSHTPLLRKDMSETQRARILSIYLRPWTLVQQHASLHVPHLLDLDVVLSPALLQLRRHRRKKRRCIETRRCMAEAWKDYAQGHIVSKHALRLIRNFTMTQMPETVEADEAEATPSVLSLIHI